MTGLVEDAQVAPGMHSAVSSAFATGIKRSWRPWTTSVGTSMRFSRRWQLCIVAASSCAR